MKFNVFYDVDGASGGAPASTAAPTAQTSTPSTPAQTTPTQATAPQHTAPQSTPASTPQPAQQTTNPTVNPKTESAKSGWTVVVDPASGIRNVKYVGGTQDQQAPAKQDMQIPAQAQSTNGVVANNATTTPPANQQAPAPDIGTISNFLNSVNGNNTSNVPAAPAVAPYKDNEFVVALQMNQVDEARVPPQYRQQYETAKQQRSALNAQAPAATPPGANQQQAPNTQAAQQQMQLYHEIGETAKQLAFKETGVTEEELAAAEYSDDANLIAKVEAYNTAVKWHETNLSTAIQMKVAQERAAAETAKAQQAAIMRDIQSEVQRMQSSEPNFAKIDAFMNERYKTLPLNEALPIAQVYADLAQNKVPTPQQAQILKKYYEDSRLDFYAQNANLGGAPKPVARPAALERPGTGANSRPETPDYSKLGKMTFAEKDRFFMDLLGKAR